MSVEAIRTDKERRSVWLGCKRNGCNDGSIVLMLWRVVSGAASGPDAPGLVDIV